MNKNSNLSEGALPKITVNKTPSGPKKCVFRARFRCFVLLLIFLFMGGALLFGGRYVWRTLDLMKLRQESQQIDLKKLQGQVAQLMDETGTQKKNFETLSGQLNFSKSEWVYSSAFYLVQQAIFQLRLNNNATAQLLLENAEKMLSNISSSEVRDIKVQLSQVIEVLKVTKKVDQTTLIAQIDQLKSQVDALPLVVLGPVVSKSSAESSSHKVWEQIKELVVIRHHDKSIEPLMEPSQALYLKQNLNLLLERASLAILYRDASLYQNTLQKAKQWVERFFDRREKRTKDFVQTLDALMKVNIMPVAPQVSGTLAGILTKLEFLGQANLRVEKVKEDTA